MPSSLAAIRAGSAPATLLLALLLSWQAQAQEPAPSLGEWTAPAIPIPRGALTELAEPGVQPELASLPGSDPEPAETMQAPAFDPSAVATGRRGTGLHPTTLVPVGVIRNGFATRDGIAPANQPRTVGVKLGQDVFSVSTTLSGPADSSGSRQASLGWHWAQPVSSGTGLIWGVSTGGTSTLGAAPEQNGDAVIGYRRTLLPHVTLTSQLGVNGQYVFGPGESFHSALVPQVKLSVDLAKAAELPWQASVDLGLARKLPLIASEHQTTGTAMLSLKYKLQ